MAVQRGRRDIGCHNGDLAAGAHCPGNRGAVRHLRKSCANDSLRCRGPVHMSRMAVRHLRTRLVELLTFLDRCQACRVPRRLVHLLGTGVHRGGRCDSRFVPRSCVKPISVMQPLTTIVSAVDGDEARALSLDARFAVDGGSGRAIVDSRSSSARLGAEDADVRERTECGWRLLQQARATVAQLTRQADRMRCVPRRIAVVC